MIKFGYLIAKIKEKIFRNHTYILNYLKNKGISMGENNHIYSDITSEESCLISLGSNITISGNVTFVTHDNSIIKINPRKSNLFGRIQIGDNCFIGMNSTILYGVTLGKNIIVASGSVVCDSFTDERIIIGGNPARIIGTWENFEDKSKDHMMTRSDFKDALIKGDETKYINRNVIRLRR